MGTLIQPPDAYIVLLLHNPIYSCLIRDHRRFPEFWAKNRYNRFVFFIDHGLQIAKLSEKRFSEQARERYCKRFVLWRKSIALCGQNMHTNQYEFIFSQACTRSDHAWVAPARRIGGHHAALRPDNASSGFRCRS